jgi:hypothetical protein
MNTAREPGANWYKLPFEKLRELMLGHGKIGRRYTSRVLQLVTGASAASGSASPVPAEVPERIGPLG